MEFKFDAKDLDTTFFKDTEFATAYFQALSIFLTFGEELVIDTARYHRQFLKDPVLKQRVTALQPRSLQTAVLLWRRERTMNDIAPDHFCFSIPDEFVVGYGLDYDDLYRNLPHIAALEQIDLSPADG